VEAGSNTSTVTLQVVGGDEKGSLKSETVKYGLKSQGTWTRERLRWQGPAARTKDRPDLSSERAPHKNKIVTVTQVINIWSWAPDGCFIPRQTGRLTVGRNVRLRLSNVYNTVSFYSFIRPITMASQSKARTVFARSNAGIMGSNPTQDMDVCVRLFCVLVLPCVGSGHVTG
jgi:hypothetical protein